MTVQKKAWLEPKLILHGDVAKITQDTNKTLGLGDGLIFRGVLLTNPS